MDIWRWEICAALYHIWKSIIRQLSSPYISLWSSASCIMNWQFILLKKKTVYAWGCAPDVWVWNKISSTWLLVSSTGSHQEKESVPNQARSWIGTPRTSFPATRLSPLIHQLRFPLSLQATSTTAQPACRLFNCDRLQLGHQCGQSIYPCTLLWKQHHPQRATALWFHSISLWR